VLDILKTLFADTDVAEIELFDIRIVTQSFTGAIQDDPTAFHNIAVIRNLQGQICILLDQQNSGAFILVDTHDDLKKLSHQQWSPAS